MERSRHSLSLFAVLAFVAMAVAVGCSAETARDPDPGSSQLNPQPLPPAPPSDQTKNDDGAGDDDDSTVGEATSSSGGTSGTSGVTTPPGSSTSSSGAPDAGKE